MFSFESNQEPEIIEDVGRANFKFNFEKGKYKGKVFSVIIESCLNPTCYCKDIRIDLSSIEKNSKGEPVLSCSFSLDIFEQRVSDEDDVDIKLSSKQKKLIDSFLEELTDEEWGKFRSNFTSLKQKELEKGNLEGLEVEFPYDKIEYEEIMLLYSDVFPYSEDFVFEKDGIEFICEDQYCLRAKCNCHDALVTIEPTDEALLPEDDGESYAIRLDYKKRKWETLSECSIAGSMDEVMEEFMEYYPDLPKILKNRHQQLRTMYKNYRMKHGLHTKNQDKQTPARNAPCPCGSGKKYKRCCGKDPIT